MEIIKERRRVRNTAIKRATEWARKLPFKATAILIGSYARGDFNLWSDIDILLITRHLKGTPVQRLKKLDVQPGFQVIPVTPSEFERLKRRKDPIAVEALMYGIVLRDDYKIAGKSQRN